MSAQHKRRGRKAKEERQRRAEERRATLFAPDITIDPDAVIDALEAEEQKWRVNGREMTEDEAADFIADAIMRQIAAQFSGEPLP